MEIGERVSAPGELQGAQGSWEQHLTVGWAVAGSGQVGKILRMSERSDIESLHFLGDQSAELLSDF